jgi:hypothetical protein
VNILLLIFSFLLMSFSDSEDRATLKLEFKPNPFAASVDVSFELEEADTLVLGVYDARNAQRARVDLGEMKAGEHTVILPTSRWRNGTYVFILTGAEGQIASGTAMKLGLEPARDDSVSIFPF